MLRIKGGRRFFANFRIVTTQGIGTSGASLELTPDASTILPLEWELGGHIRGGAQISPSTGSDMSNENEALRFRKGKVLGLLGQFAGLRVARENSDVIGDLIRYQQPPA